MRFFSSFQHFMCQHHLSFRLVLGLVGIFFLMGTPLSPFYPFFLVKFKLSYDDVKSTSESFSLLFLFQKKIQKILASVLTMMIRIQSICSLCTYVAVPLSTLAYTRNGSQLEIASSQSSAFGDKHNDNSSINNFSNVIKIGYVYTNFLIHERGNKGFSRKHQFRQK